ASLKFRMQGNSLTVEVRTPQEIQNQVTFMESYRLVRNLQNMGITLESLRINGVEMVPKGIRFPRREEKERFNIGENEGPPEEAGGRPADSPGLSLLL
ncbi:MAG: hypothetical protein Q9N26_01620, partial [Aquificota bacterium]|nr:hypothetical protein [Aquificota bacterium]